MKKSAFSAMLGSVLGVVLVGQLPFISHAATYNIVGTDVKTPSQSQIAKLYQDYGIKEALTTADTFDEDPSYESPYSSGELSDESQEQALDTLNFSRYVAGINYNIELDDEYTQYAQDAAWINAITQEISHDPDTPHGMSDSDSLVVSGKYGASKSNLSQTLTTRYDFSSYSLTDDILDGWLGDSSSDSNLTAVGHRRWALNPLMGKTGFGSAIIDSTYTSEGFDKYYAKFGAMYSVDQSNSNGNVDGVIWPSQNMPTEIFEESYPWSYSTSQEINGDITVKLTHLNSGDVWEIDSSDNDLDSTYLSVQMSHTNTYMGQKTCIIFRPDPEEVKYQDGDVFYVEITGDIVASYGVFFFDVDNTSATSGSLTPSATATSFTYDGNDDATTYTITFDGNNGTSDETTLVTGTSGKLSSLPEATRENYTFNGWYTSKTGSTKVTTSTVFDANTTVYAQWAAVVVDDDEDNDSSVYTITFDGNRGTASTDTVETSAGKITTLPTATRDDFNFLGWYTTKTGSVKVTTSTVFDDDTTVYAQWTTADIDDDTDDDTDVDDDVDDEETTFTISFDANSGTCALETKDTATTGKLTSLPTATRSGYEFEGWFTTETGSTEVTTATVFDEDSTIYAQWMEVETEVTSTDKAENYINKLSVQSTTGSNFGGKVVLSNYSPVEDEVVTLTVTPYIRYNIYSVTVKTSTGSSVTLKSNNEGEYSFTQTDESLEITVIFDFVPTDAPTDSNLNVQVNFPDVTVNDWHEPYVRHVVGLEIMTGYDNYFYPDIAISRGEIARSLLNLSGHTASINWEMGYHDVYGTGYEDAVSWCLANGIMTGYSDEMFGTYYALTREEFAVTLASFARYMGHNGYAMTVLSPLYDDTWTISWWALNSFTWCVENGLMIGYDYVLSPKDSLTRGQIAAILTSFDKNLLS